MLQLSDSSYLRKRLQKRRHYHMAEFHTVTEILTGRFEVKYILK